MGEKFPGGLGVFQSFLAHMVYVTVDHRMKRQLKNDLE